MRFSKIPRFSQRVFASAVAAAATVAAVTAIALPASAAGAGRSGGWGPAQRVVTPESQPGVIESVACAPKGYCAAVGTVSDQFPYALTETNGRWSKIKVFDLSLLKTGGDTRGSAAGLVACPSAGNCSAIGQFTDQNAEQFPFTVNEKNGTWGKAHAITMPVDTTDLGGQIFSLACSSAGNCVAGGQFSNDSQSEDMQPFVVSEKNGVWGAAEELPGTSDLSIVQGSWDSISCTTKNTCLATGSYLKGSINDGAVEVPFVAFTKNGVWRIAKPIPGLPSGTVSPSACSRDGTCTGVTADQAGVIFTVTEKNGRWDTTPHDIAGTGARGIFLQALSCPSAGNCSADGTNIDNVPFVTTERNGTWTKIENVPGIGLLNHGRGFEATITGLSCGTPGNCAATGVANVYVTATKVRSEAFVVSEIGGRWHFAQIVPGVVNLDKQGDSRGNAVACWSASHCAAGGFFAVEHSTSPFPFVALQH